MTISFNSQGINVLLFSTKGYYKIFEGQTLKVMSIDGRKVLLRNKEALFLRNRRLEETWTELKDKDSGCSLLAFRYFGLVFEFDFWL